MSRSKRGRSVSPAGIARRRRAQDALMSRGSIIFVRRWIAGSSLVKPGNEAELDQFDRDPLWRRLKPTTIRVIHAEYAARRRLHRLLAIRSDPAAGARRGQRSDAG